MHVVGLEDGSDVRSRAVIIATGVSYPAPADPWTRVLARRRCVLRGRSRAGAGDGRQARVRGRRRQLGRASPPRWATAPSASDLCTSSWRWPPDASARGHGQERLERTSLYPSGLSHSALGGGGV